MKKEQGKVYLELSDLIRINQLVRKEINAQEFIAWYESVNDQSEKNELILQLFEFAHQSNIDDEIIKQVLTDTKLKDLDEELVNDFRRRNWHRLEAWLLQASNSEKKDIFILAFNLFGYAERRVLENENIECCNHWWHRDILDPEVVRSILDSREYDFTSMKTDS